MSENMRNESPLALFILRHGEATFQAHSDHQRPLTSQGVNEAYAAGLALCEWINDLGLAQELELIVSVSDALRAIETWESVNQALIDSSLKVNKLDVCSELYLAPSQKISDYILSKIHQETQADPHTPPHIKLFVLIGHNPGLSDLVYLLSSDFITLKTGAYTRLKPLDSSWARWAQC